MPGKTKSNSKTATLTSSQEPKTAPSGYGDMPPSGRRVSRAMGSRGSLADVLAVQSKLGNLKVNVIKAAKLGNKELLSKSDPYVMVTVGSQEEKTRVVDNDLNPTFNQEFNFTVSDDTSEVLFSVWDKNTFTRDEFICFGYVSLANLNKNEKKFFSVKMRGCKEDSVLDVELTPDYDSPTQLNRLLIFEFHYLEEDMERMEKKMKEVELENNEFRKKQIDFDKMTSELVRLRIDKDKGDGDVELLRKDMKRVILESEELRRKNAESDKKIADYEYLLSTKDTEFDKLAKQKLAELVALKQKVDEKNHEISALQQQNISLQTILEETRKQLEDAKKTIKDLLEEGTDYKKITEKLELTIKEYTYKNDQLTKDNNDLRDRLSRMDQQCNNANEQIFRIQKEEETLKKKLKESEEIIKNLKKELENWKSKCASKDDQIKYLKDEINRLESEKKTQKSEITKLQANIGDLEAKLAAAYKQLEKKQIEIEKLEKAYHLSQEESSQQILIITNEKKVLQQEVRDLKLNIQNLNITIDNLNKTLDKALKDIKKEQSQSSILLLQINELKIEIEELKQRIQERELKITMCEKTIVELKEQSEGSGRDAAQWEEKYRRVMDIYQRMKGEDSELARIRDGMTQQMTQRMREMDRALLEKLAFDIEMMDQTAVYSKIRLSKDEFEEFLSRVPTHLQSRFQQVAHDFPKFDINKDNVIDYSELMAMLDTVMGMEGHQPVTHKASVKPTVKAEPSKPSKSKSKTTTTVREVDVRYTQMGK